MKELIVALDLELNQPSRRVVQIGAVLGNVRTGEVVSQFDLNVNPREPFSRRIAELTGISPQEIESAPSLAEAGQALAAWLAPRDSRRLLNPLTWEEVIPKPCATNSESHPSVGYSDAGGST
jgi:DNA polymerase III epsilon subunit-like protein